MFRMHMHGLKRMVDIRGGLNTIRETNAMVANSVFWIFVVAMYEIPYPGFDNTLPPFAPHEYNLHIPIPHEPLDVHSHFSDIDPSIGASRSVSASRSTDINEKSNVDLLALGLAFPIAAVLTSIQHVSHLVPTNEAYPTAATSSVVLTRMCTLLSHLLSIRLHSQELQSHMVADAGTTEFQPSHSYLVSECTRLALLLHVFTPWRGLPPDVTLSMNILLHQLITSLQKLLQSLEFENNVLVLWIFAAGGVVAAGMPERKWFVGHLVEIVQQMGVNDLETWKMYLKCIVWHENLCGRNYRALWEEVDGKRKEFEEE
ncbi:hypothetical protein DL98DRAFT_96548 [Cadophora sp. DSE1049]|nr:hypothetical protein DL98DRAFT_96548 [Cadophora sp. DSE1049]